MKKHLTILVPDGENNLSSIVGAYKIFTRVNEYWKETGRECTLLCLQQEPGNMKMLAVEFKTREWCRAELKDFEYDVHFSIVSASVYFTGTNFSNTEKGFITSNSLKPISAFMARCAPGSIVVFDDVKVKGPDNQIRTIQGKTILLH
jgi:hypothetical protein